MGKGNNGDKKLEIKEKGRENKKKRPGQKEDRAKKKKRKYSKEGKYQCCGAGHFWSAFEISPAPNLCFKGFSSSTSKAVKNQNMVSSAPSSAKTAR